MDETEADETFKLSNSSGKFAAKTNDIFGCLSVIEKKYEADHKNHSEDDDLCKPDPVEEDMRCISSAGSRGHQNRDVNKPYYRPQDAKHSTFAMPQLPARSHRGRRSFPDHRQNPERWTQYTLEDVSGNEMSESSNTQAAFAFLEERRKLRELAEDPESFIPANVDDTACSKGAITFVRKKSDKTELSGKKSKGVALPQLQEEDAEDKDSAEGIEKDSSSEKVSFKSKKGQRKNFRSRRQKDDDDDNDDEDNG